MCEEQEEDSSIKYMYVCMYVYNVEDLSSLEIPAKHTVQ